MKPLAGEGDSVRVICSAHAVCGGESSITAGCLKKAGNEFEVHFQELATGDIDVTKNKSKKSFPSTQTALFIINCTV